MHVPIKTLHIFSKSRKFESTTNITKHTQVCLHIEGVNILHRHLFLKKIEMSIKKA